MKVLGLELFNIHNQFQCGAQQHSMKLEKQIQVALLPREATQHIAGLSICFVVVVVVVVVFAASAVTNPNPKPNPRQTNTLRPRLSSSSSDISCNNLKQAFIFVLGNTIMIRLTLRLTYMALGVAQLFN